MKNILVAIDLKESDRIILERAKEIANRFGAKIWLLHVAAPDPYFVGYEIGPQYIRDGRADELRKEHKLIDSYVKQLRGSAIDAEGLLIQGGTAEMILLESKKLQIDLVVIGHYEHNMLYRTFVDSTESEIINKSDVPLMIVPLKKVKMEVHA